MYKVLTMVGSFFVALASLLTSMGTFGLVGEIEPPQSLLR